jgi:hypothetical protein
VETLLADIIGAPVQQRCQTDPVPKCYFELEVADP